MTIDLVIQDEFGIFSPTLAAKAFGWFKRFKGGGNPKSPTSAVGDTALAQESRQKLYPILQRGMEGRGLTTDALDAVRRRTAFTGLDNAFATVSSELNSNLTRMVLPNDRGPTNFINDGMNREYITAKDNIRRGFKTENLADKDVAMGMAASEVGNEMRMGMSGMQTYNQAVASNAMTEARMGTFGTNLMGGLGSGLTSMYFAQKWNSGKTA